MKKLMMALVGFACFGFGQIAVADEYAMSYSAKELSNVEGVKDLHSRIVKVAKRYCPTYSQIRSNPEVDACVQDVVNDLVAKVDHPRLSAYHAGDDSVRVAATEGARRDKS